MESDVVDVLRYTHDAVVVSIRFWIREDYCRECFVSLIIDSSAGHPFLDGRHITIGLHDLVLAKHSVVGFMNDLERVSSWGSELSPSMVDEVERLVGAGFGSAERSFSVSFHSGSLIEGICRSITVDFGDIGPGAGA